MLTMDNVLFHRKTRYTTQCSNDIEAQVSVPTKKQNCWFNYGSRFVLPEATGAQLDVLESIVLVSKG